MFYRKIRQMVAGAFSASLFCTSLFAADAIQINKTEFNIPFEVENSNGQSATGDAMLFMSKNGGNMEHASTVPASAGKFKFKAQSDGLYEFTVRMTDAAGKPLGAVGPLLPEISVEVDTVAPELSFRLSESSPGEVSVLWNCSESKVAAGSLRLEYAEGTDGRWKPVVATPGASGKTSITSTPGTAVSVRGFISDLAGNQGGGSSQIVLNAQVADSTTTTYGGPVNSGAPVGLSPFNGSPGSEIVLPGNTASNMGTPTVQPTQPGGAVPFPNGITVPQQNFSTQQNVPPQNNFVQQAPVQQAPDQRAPVRQNYILADRGQSATTASPAGPMYGTYNGSNNPPVVPPANNFAKTSQGVRQLVNHQVFNIDYQVDDVGPSGVSAVELFVTENNGREWFAYGNDIDMRSPFQVDTLGEGTFGFAVRVRNGLGFRATPPQAGELPSIVVTVDKTAPVAEMAMPQVIVDRVGQIRVAWRVSDQNPSATPVRLEYGASAAGPWTIAFDWQADVGAVNIPIQSGMPTSMYFRLLARDAAGNIATTQTHQPILIDQQRPTARLLSIQTVNNGQRL